jgi:photosystem II stability/assembly factor-like uncharacterized protein
MNRHAGSCLPEEFEMGFKLARGLLVFASALTSSLAVSGAALAAPDVLERPALVRTAERVSKFVYLGIHNAGKRLVAVGERGLILWSDDDGMTWRQAKVPISVTLTSVFFSDDKNGWATGHSGVVLHSTDGGQSWVKQLDGVQAAQLVVDESKKLGTNTSFATDAERLVTDGPDKPFLDVHFADANNGLIVGAYGLIFSTNDGGRTWKPLQTHIENPKGLHIYAIHQTGGAIYLAGEQGAVFVSTDRGENFRIIRTPYNGSYFGTLSSGQNLIVFGMRGNAYWSSDEGSSWQKCDVQGASTLTAGIRLKDGRLILTDDTGAVFVSFDDGKRFTSIGLPKLPPLTSVLETPGGQFLFAGISGLNRSIQPQFPRDNTK